MSDTSKLRRFFLNRTWIPWLAGIASLIAYLPVLPAQVSGANFGNDSPELVAAILSGGVAHPTGYPTYLLLGHIFEWLPISTPYWRAALLSALAAACTAGIVAGVAANQLKGWARTAGLVGGMALALALLFASQAVIPEVNTLNALGVVLVLVWAGKIGAWRKAERITLSMFMLPLASGAGVGNHITILLALPLIAFPTFQYLRSGFAWRPALLQFVGFAFGLLVYLYLLLAARTHPPINWGDPESIAGFWWLLSGAPYQDLLFSVPLGTFLSRLLYVVRLLVGQFTLPGLILAAWGLWEAGTLRFKTLWIFLGFTFFAAVYNTSDSQVYLLPAWAMVAIWLGIGGGKLAAWKWKQQALGAVLLAALLGWLAFQAVFHWSEIDPRRDTETPAFLAAFEQLPQGALVLASSDAGAFPLWYDVFGLRRRTDLRVVIVSLAPFAWYQRSVLAAYPDLNAPPVGDWIPGQPLWGEELVRLNPDRPLCRSGTEAELRFLRCAGNYVYFGNLVVEGWK